MINEIYQPKNNIRIVTATSLFDGHDASINIIRRMLQDTGAEVIHLGHNRSVEEIVSAAIDEDVQGIAISSYQGGHVEFFKYMIDLLKENNASQIKVFGGGGGVIVPLEIKELEEYGVTKIYSPEDGTTMGLQGMINHMVQNMDFPIAEFDNINYDILSAKNKQSIAKIITSIEESKENDKETYDKIISKIKTKIDKGKIPVIGITGTGGAGKSSLIDDIVMRAVHDIKDFSMAIFSSDPTRKKTGGALLGDRIRMNSIFTPQVYMRSFATRNSHSEISNSIIDAIDAAKAAGFNLILAETAGVGQADTAITDMVDISIYVMTSEFGAASQLEKISMLDYADIVVINKFEKHGAEDALRDVRKQVQRNRKDFEKSTEEMPVFGTIASQFNDDGVTSLYHYILKLIGDLMGIEIKSEFPKKDIRKPSKKSNIIPSERRRYLSEISETLRKYHSDTKEGANSIRKLWHLRETEEELNNQSSDLAELKSIIKKTEKNIPYDSDDILSQWEIFKKSYNSDELIYHIRGKEIKVPLYTKSLAGTNIPKVSIPKYKDPGEIYQWMRSENLPGYFPFAAGVFPLKRTDEHPTRMFAGEGDPARTNKRFKLLSDGYSATRLSTAFDSVTLYGYDPDLRPDIYGKVGTSGVSVCTLEDVKVLYGGFDLCSPTTSVSMTINGPAPIMLAMFLNSAIDQQIEKFESTEKRKASDEEYENIKKDVLHNVRGTVQADILKEDQGQNTCLFAIDFAIKMMGDIQQYFIDNNVRNLYSVSISGYHIAEAGANPITQLAFTLANGFTYIEYYLSRGMDIDKFAPNLSFFFSNGMDPEYTVIGRVARRIWAIAMKEKYGASKGSQMLKYHIQTSGRSLHCQEIQFNDIRTSLQALCAIYDNCNSLHTNAFDEAITTPSSESVRRALAIQQIINSEWGLAKNENVNQGSFIVEELTSLVEEAVLSEFERITERGGVLGAMETAYQRSKIQDESIYYEELKHSGALPIIGVNTFLNENSSDNEEINNLELARATEEEKQSQLKRLNSFHEIHSDKSQKALGKLQECAIKGENIFNELMSTVKYCSLGQITEALNEVGGQYRRNM